MRAGSALPLLFVLLVPQQGAVHAAERPQPKVHGTFSGDPMYTVLPPGAIPAISEPRIIGAAEARKQMAPSEPVIGIVVAGQARAYSTWQLDSHEIVNDELGGAAIAATW